jgi:hypothetical protein
MPTLCGLVRVAARTVSKLRYDIHFNSARREEPIRRRDFVRFLGTLPWRGPWPHARSSSQSSASVSPESDRGPRRSTSHSTSVSTNWAISKAKISPWICSIRTSKQGHCSSCRRARAAALGSENFPAPPEYGRRRQALADIAWIETQFRQLRNDARSRRAVSAMRAPQYRILEHSEAAAARTVLTIGDSRPRCATMSSSPR